jgi:hypothetical protein
VTIQDDAIVASTPTADASAPVDSAPVADASMAGGS